MTGSIAAGRDPLIDKLRLMDEHQIDGFIKDLTTVDEPVIVGFLNQHGYNLAQHQSRIFNSFMRMNFLLRDGLGIRLACRFNGREPRANLNGSDFIPRVVDHLTGHAAERCQFFALGTQEPWLSKGAGRLFDGQGFHAIDGFREPAEYIDFVLKQRHPDKLSVIVLAMGMPKQEEVAIKLQQQLDGPALMICGGAIIDFAADRFPRAPLAWRRLGLEWLFRLLMEPRRLFHRYVVGIPVFFGHVWRNGRLARRQQNVLSVMPASTGSASTRQRTRDQGDDESLERTLSP